MNALNRDGLTLVEVLIAMVVISVAFVALSTSQVMNLKITRDSREASLATQAANRQIEILTQRILDDYATYKNCPGASVCSGTETQGTEAVEYEIYRDPAQYALEGLVRIDVTVVGASTASLSHFVSCMDVSPPPTVASPGACN